MSGSLLRDMDALAGGIRKDLRGIGSVVSSASLAADTRGVPRLFKSTDLITGAGTGAAGGFAKLAGAEATLDKSMRALGGANVGSVAGIRVGPSAKYGGLGALAGTGSPPKGTLPDPIRPPSPISSIAKAADLFAEIANPEPPALLSAVLGTRPRWSAAKTMPSLLGLGTRESAAGPNGWQGGPIPQVSGFSSFASGAATTSAWGKVVETPKLDRWFGFGREMYTLGTSVENLMARTMPIFDALGRALGHGLGGLFRFLERIDFEAIERTARIREARRPRTQIGFAALDAYDELYMNRPWVADRFLVDYLGLEPNDDTREGLWRVLKWTFERRVPRPAKWLILDDEGAARYLRTAVYREAKRVRRDKEMPDRVWWTERDPETRRKVELPTPTRQPEDVLELMMKASENPAEIVARRMDDRAQVLALLYQEGSAEDREFVGLLLTGHEPVDIAHLYGWPKVQRFTRKATRWRIRINGPTDG